MQEVEKLGYISYTETIQGQEYIRDLVKHKDKYYQITDNGVKKLSTQALNKLVANNHLITRQIDITPNAPRLLEALRHI